MNILDPSSFAKKREYSHLYSIQIVKKKILLMRDILCCSKESKFFLINCRCSHTHIHSSYERTYAHPNRMSTFEIPSQHNIFEIYEVRGAL